ncbi:ADP-glyceromanno-heptose 6-epimerase [Demequina maris]|uniref:ADP-glyceromanno-heptose 6-epimerase n=1 Tax=Demequina maris TaxID=1638982 RepID=UPI0007818DBD|nr:ADP-glyceromanno-heptose 6-epimerase [Demequina maris]
MIVVSGAAGFIGSYLLGELEAAGRGPLVACDWLGTDERWRNIAKRRLWATVPPEALAAFLDEHADAITHVIHMGAISATTERDVDALLERNILSTIRLWDWCAANGKAFIYASSAATYGAQEGICVDDDSGAALAALRPLNAYGWSKKAVDDAVTLRAESGAPTPPQWVGLKFFNVYGPNEYHKDDMRSVVSKMYDAWRAGEPVRLFRSARPDIADGEQRRDFVYVRDCARVIGWILDHPEVTGVFNVGSGRAETFAEMHRSLETALGAEVPLEWVDMPGHLVDRYQYFTQADISRLRALGMDVEFATLEQGVEDYVANYLHTEDPYR